MPSPNSKPAIARRAALLCSCRTMEQLARLLESEISQLQLFAVAPSYYCFPVRKSNGTVRQIEAPDNVLKQMLRSFSDYLQAVYYTIKSPAAYGYIISSSHDHDPRNILTNAEKHVGHPCLMNADLEDFFHDVKEEMLYALFRQKPFTMDHETAELAAALVCYKGRLPMGSPTSPVLSNFALLALDYELLKHCAAHDITYTRFVDDMSFSGCALPAPELYAYIVTVAVRHGFSFNEQKLKIFGPGDAKMVTGLLLNSRPELPPSFFDMLEKDCTRLRSIREVKVPLGFMDEEPWLVLLRQQIEGRLALISMIYGKQSKDYRQAAAKYSHADDVPVSVYSNSWLDFPYCF